MNGTISIYKSLKRQFLRIAFFLGMDFEVSVIQILLVLIFTVCQELKTLSFL